MNFREQLNDFYKKLDDKAEQIKNILIKNGFQAEKKYSNGQYNKNAAGEYVKEYFPIPVIEVKDLCEIEIVGMRINITSMTNIDNAIHFDYSKISEYYYEVYGVVNYLSDYYKNGEELSVLFKNLGASEEQEIGFAFSLADDIKEDKILSLVNLLKSNAFYYWGVPWINLYSSTAIVY